MSDVERMTAARVKSGKRRMRRVRTGVVESDVRDKTIKVRIDRLMRHPKYGKYLKRRVVLHAHDEKNEAKVGDMVRIEETRPLSKLKNWRLVGILKRHEGVEPLAVSPTAGV